MIGMESTSQKLHDRNLIFLVHNGDCAEGNSRLETGDDCRKRSSREAELDVPHSSIDARDDCRKRSSREAEVDVQHSSTERDGCQKHSSVVSELDFKHSKIDDSVKDGYLGMLIYCAVIYM